MPLTVVYEGFSVAYHEAEMFAQPGWSVPGRVLHHFITCKSLSILPTDYGVLTQYLDKRIKFIFGIQELAVVLYLPRSPLILTIPWTSTSLQTAQMVY